MLKKEDIEHLATLVRMELTEEEAAEVALKLTHVLAYVSEISQVSTEDHAEDRVGELRNVMRLDTSPNLGGEFTDVILANAPRKEDGYFKVSQIM